MLFTLSAPSSMPAAQRKHARATASSTSADATGTTISFMDAAEECRRPTKRRARESSDTHGEAGIFLDYAVVRSLDCMAYASPEDSLLASHILPGILKDVLREDSERRLLNVLSMHQGAVAQLVAVAVRRSDTYAEPLDYSSYPCACSLRLLSLTVSSSAKAFDTLMRHADLSSLYSILALMVRIAQQEVHRRLVDSNVASSASASASASALTMTTMTTTTTTVSSAVFQNQREILNVREAIVDAVRSQPSPWLTPGLANGVTALWLLLAISHHSPRQLHVVLTRFPDILWNCTQIVAAASQPECFRLTRGSGIYGVAWRVLRRVVECDSSFLRINTMAVITTLLRGITTHTDELAVLAARTACAVTETRAFSMMTGDECCDLAKMLVGMLLRHCSTGSASACGSDDAGESSVTATIKRLVVVSMHHLIFQVAEVAEVFMQPVAADVLAHVICSECFSVDKDSLTCARRAVEIYSHSTTFLSQKQQRNDLALAAVVRLTNAVLSALDACLGMAEPGIVQQTVPFLYSIFAKWSAVAAAGIIVPAGLPARAVAVLETLCVHKEACRCQAVYNAAYVVRLLASRAALTGLQVALPVLLEIGGGKVKGCDENAREVQEMAVTAIASILCNPVPCVYFADAGVCASIVRMAAALFVSHDHMARMARTDADKEVPTLKKCSENAHATASVTVTVSASASASASNSHVHDLICVSAVVCLKHIISKVSDDAVRRDFISQLLGNDQFMQVLYIMAHPGYRCDPSKYGFFFPALLEILVPSPEDMLSGRKLAVVAFLEAVALMQKQKQKHLLLNASDKDKGLACCICLVPIAAEIETEVSEQCYYTHGVCRQNYHPQCLGQWLALKDSCPSCRMSVLEA